MNMDPVLKYCNEDFRVSEISLLPNDLSSKAQGKKYTILRIKKEGYTTFEVMQRLADFFKSARHDIHCQGLKDEDGITEQTMSINRIIEKRETDFFNKSCASLPKGWVQMSIRGFSIAPVKEKSLHGNVFNITVRNLDGHTATRLNKFCSEASDFICANYYDRQRFGLPGGPYVAHHIGKAIIEANWQEANRLYKESGNMKLDYPDRAPVGELSIKNIDYRKLNFFTAAYASYIWNKELSDRINAQADMQIFNGLIVSSLFGESEPINPILSSESYSVDQNMKVFRKRKARSALMSTTLFASNKRVDDHFDSKWALDLQFFLPSGSYATMLVKQLLLASDSRIDS